MTDRHCATCGCKLSRPNPADKCRPCLGSEAGLTAEDYPLPEGNGYRDAVQEALDDALRRGDLHEVHGPKANIHKPRCYIGKQIWRKLNGGKVRLTPRQWQVAEMHLVKGYTLAGIARLLGIAEGTVRTHWARVIGRVFLSTPNG